MLPVLQQAPPPRHQTVTGLSRLHVTNQSLGSGEIEIVDTTWRYPPQVFHSFSYCLVLCIQKIQCSWDEWGGRMAFSALTRASDSAVHFPFPQFQHWPSPSEAGKSDQPLLSLVTGFLNGIKDLKSPSRHITTLLFILTIFKLLICMDLWFRKMPKGVNVTLKQNIKTYICKFET